MKKHSRAFTLIELLIASSLFIIIAITVYSAFQTGVFGFKKISSLISLHQEASGILERMNAELRNSFVFSKKKTYFSGTSTGLQFLAILDYYSGESLTQRLTHSEYVLSGKTLLRKRLYNQDIFKNTSAPEIEEAAGNITSISFSYGYLAGEPPHMLWKDFWDDTQKLPDFVRVKLLLYDGVSREFERTIFLKSKNSLPHG